MLDRQSFDIRYNNVANRTYMLDRQSFDIMCKVRPAYRLLPRNHLGTYQNKQNNKLNKVKLMVSQCTRQQESQRSTYC